MSTSGIEARAAVSHYKVLERLLTPYGRFALVEVRIETGRTHQIRVHLAHLGHPVLGDERYGDFELNRRLRKEGLRRMFLHAASLELRHPSTGEALRLAAPLPAELARFRDRHMGEPG